MNVSFSVMAHFIGISSDAVDMIAAGLMSRRVEQDTAVFRVERFDGDRFLISNLMDIVSGFQFTDLPSEDTQFGIRGINYDGYFECDKDGRLILPKAIATTLHLYDQIWLVANTPLSTNVQVHGWCIPHETRESIETTWQETRTRHQTLA
jgi:hypothetical protein